MLRWRLVSLFIISLLTGVSVRTDAAKITAIIGNVGHCYYPRAYVATVPSHDELYNSSSDNIVASSAIAPDGRFTVSVPDLPKDKRLYRLYFNETNTSAATIMTGSRRNYFILLLDDVSDIIIDCPDICAKYATYTVNDSENNSIARFQDIKSHYLEALEDGQQPMSKARRRFLNTRFYEQLKDFATSADPLCGLPAVTDIIEIVGNGMGEIDTADHSLFMSDFAGRLAARYPKSDYTHKFLSTVSSYAPQGKERVSTKPELIIPVTVLLICSLGLNVALLIRRKKRSIYHEPMNPPLLETEPALIEGELDDKHRAHELINSLSIKEREILGMLHKGFSNKEIADKMNVELSTVKTHVSRIYQKTGISSRKEVAAIARFLPVV